MIKKIIYILFMAIAVNASAQITALEAKGVTFPEISGQTLADKYIELPIKNGKKTVVGIAYSRAAEADLKKWLNPIYNTFMVKEGNTKNFDVAEIYDVNFVFIPVIAGLKNVIADFKASTDKEFWPYIMDTQKTDIKKLRETLKAKDEKIPYFYVLEDSGKIIEVVSGAFKEDKMDKLEAAAE